MIASTGWRTQRHALTMVSTTIILYTFEDNTDYIYEI